jgi:hypothetical protein
MKVSLETYLRIFEKQSGLCTCPNCLPQLPIRPYSCPCDGAQCLGWQMIHDANVRMAVALGAVKETEARTYRRKLGKRYNTTPWIYSATKQ